MVLHDQQCIAGGDQAWRWSGWVGLGQHPFNSVAVEWMCIQNPLLPQAENGNGDGFNDISLIHFNLNSMFSGVANKPVPKSWEVELR